MAIEHEFLPDLHPHRHIILYAKGHYKKRKSQISDLKVLLSDCSGIPLRYVTSNDVLFVLVGLTYPAIKDSGNSDAAFMRFCTNILEERSDDVRTRIIRSCLRILHLMKVKKDGLLVINLGKPDPEILPLKETSS